LNFAANAFERGEHAIAAEAAFIESFLDRPAQRLRVALAGELRFAEHGFIFLFL
jgi:hypothetical protein